VNFSVTFKAFSNLIKSTFAGECTLLAAACLGLTAHHQGPYR